MNLMKFLSFIRWAAIAGMTVVIRLSLPKELEGTVHGRLTVIPIESAIRIILERKGYALEKAADGWRVREIPLRNGGTDTPAPLLPAACVPARANTGTEACATTCRDSPPERHGNARRIQWLPDQPH